MLRSTCVFAALALIALAHSARAQSDYPNKPITLVIPLPPGGTNDIMARTVADKMSAAMKASKEPCQVGTPGVSTVNHLSALLFAQQAGVKLQTIPYKGSQPLITDLIGGFVKVGFNPIPVSRAAIEGNLIRALAAT